MPAPVVAAGIGGIASIAGGLIGSHSAGKAADAQTNANDQALAFQKEQAAKAEAAYRQQWDAWNSARQALLQRYGIDISSPQASAAPGVAQGGAPGGLQAGPPPGMDAGQPQVGAAPMAGGMPGYKGMTLGELMMRNPSGWGTRNA